jgi:riboflavin kinase / FMN adenylyltransferase
MKIASHWNKLPKCSPPIVLTIGTFDGMHLGHQALLERMKALAGSNGTRAVLTFANSPSTVLQRQKNAFPLVSLQKKLSFFKEQGIDLIILLSFNHRLASLSFRSFLHTLHQNLPFSHLVLGKGASFGNKREGNEKNIKKISKELAFETHYLPKTKKNGLPVSSTRIRKAIQNRDFAKAEKLLGRPFSMEFTQGSLRKIPPLGILSLRSLSLPIDGMFEILLLQQGIRIPTLLYSEAGKAQIPIPLKENFNPMAPFECIFLKALSKVL